MLIWRALLLSLLVSGPVAQAADAPPAAPATRDPNSYFFDQGFGNLPDEVKAARQEGKQGIVIMFETADCPWCAKMMATVLNQAAVQDYYRQHFRILQVDTNGDVPMTDFSGKELAQKDFAFKHNRVRATPVFAFFDLDGRLLTKYTGATKDVEEFMWLGEFVVNGSYRSTNFTAYKRDRQGAKP